jgi:signal transduction histidine kinase
MRRESRDEYQAWLLGVVLLIGLLGAALALFVTFPSLRNASELPEVRLFLDSAVMLAAGFVAVLAGVRFSVEGRKLDFLLCGGFFVAALSTFSFSIAPVFGGESIGRSEAWAGLCTRLVVIGMIAASAFTRGRIARRRRALLWLFSALAVATIAIWVLARALDEALPALGEAPPVGVIVIVALQAVLSLVALIGFALHIRREGQDLDRWLGLAVTLFLFAELHYVFTPVVSNEYVSQGDFLRLLSYGVLLAGVWRAIRFAEFGRAVAEERARVAREIHDGLAQYLFAISAHATMLESGAAPEKTLDRLKQAAAAAQQEARFAILALSSASGSVPFDAALRRYVDILTADGKLDVELDIDHELSLAPDEQIEVFRIIQEGLANVRRHAGARRAEVSIGRKGSQRVVRVLDDGGGLAGAEEAAGQGLKNLRVRAASIGGAFTLRSWPGRGTALEVILRA